MKTGVNLYCLGLIASSHIVFAREQKVDAVKSDQLYRSGKKHQEIMDLKMNTWQTARSRGEFNQEDHPELRFTECSNGKAEAIRGDRAHTFRCSNADLYHFLSHADLGSAQAGGSSSWGWTSVDGREFVAIGQYEGTAFVEIDTTTGRMTYLGRLPAYSRPSEWREIRSYKDYMIIGSEAEGHGIQIFDMKRLLDINQFDGPRIFDARDDLTGHFTALLPLGRAHNVVINEELRYAVAVGAQPREDPICGAGLNFIGLDDPSNPVSLGCANGDGYVHDAQCLVYRGPDTRYSGTDICYAFNEDSFTIYNVTDKANTTNIISKISYEGASYTHQGWVLDPENQEYLLLDDEYDEVDRAGLAGTGFPVTYIWDIRNLEAPRQTGYFQARFRGIDHNQYVHEGYTYQSNYGAGLRVMDVTSIPVDPSGNSVCEVAYFDIHPEDDTLPGGGAVTFAGSWSNYPYFRSGFIFVNTIERGAYTIKLQEKKCPRRANPPKNSNFSEILNDLLEEWNYSGRQKTRQG